MSQTVEETTEERYLHAMYDAWKMLCEEGHAGTTSAAILAGVLAHAEYPPYQASALEALGT